MCQLLGMSANVPTDICFSFDGFRKRGGLTDKHADGWGIAFFEGRGVRVFLDPCAASHSPIAELVRTYPIKSSNVVAHIRRATQGAVALENCHPFQREMWGRPWVFAHNGDLPGFRHQGNDGFQPVGTTDSEAAFCTILNHLHRSFPGAMPGIAELHRVLAQITHELNAVGPLNYLLSNGQFLIAHCSTQLHYVVRQSPFRKAHLIDGDVTVDFQRLTQPTDRVAIIATLPLTDDEVWLPLPTGSLVVFADGMPLTLPD
ncbi:MAG TPA: class II glutamine amidotransferase [Polyangiaceae bacterium]